MRKTLLIFFIFTILTACSSKGNSNIEDTSPSGEPVKQEINEAGQEIKQNLLNQLDAIKQESEVAREEKGYIYEEDFIKIKKDFRRLAKDAYSEVNIEFNDTQEVDEKIALLEADINQLSNEELSSVEDLFNSGGVLYEAMIQEDLHLVISGLDLSNSYNDLRSFLTLTENATTEAEIYSLAADYSENLEEYEIGRLLAIQEIVSENATAFTEAELSQLNDALQHFMNAAEKQMKVLSQFKEYYLDDGSDIADIIYEAKDEYDAGVAQINELEDSLGIDEI